MTAETTQATSTNPTATPSPFIRITGLRKTFGTATVLKDLDLTVPEGQFLVLLGPSGCGKTTTMRCLVGLETAEAGSIEVAGTTVFDSRRGIDVPPNKRSMGLVFQSYALWPHKNVYGNVGFPLQMQRVPKRTIQQRVDEVLELVGLDGFGRRPIPTLSGGQMQRVALARSLVMDPTILLLDEPLSNLDAKLRVHLRHELREIQQRVGVTTVYVTHDQDEALGLADRIVVMREGTVAQEGRPEEIYTAPASAFVADFLGVSNQFPVAVSISGGRVVAELAGGSRLLASDRRADPDGPAIAGIRPERIAVHARRPSEAADTNLVDGEVLSVQFQGSRLRYHVALDRGPGMFCERPVTTERLAPGDRCTVAIHADDVLVLNDGTAAGPT